MHSTASSSDYESSDYERLRRQAAEEHQFIQIGGKGGLYLQSIREAPIMVEEAQQLPEQQYSSDPEEQPA